MLLQGRIDLAPVDIGAEASRPQHDLAAGRMFAEAAALLGAAAFAPGRDERQGLLEREARRIGIARQGRIDLAPIDIGAEAAGLDREGTARGMVPEGAACGGRLTAETTAGEPAFFGNDEIDRAVAADLEDILVLAYVRIGLAVLNIGAEAADTGEDRLLRLGMPCDLARQRQKPDRLFESQLVGGNRLRQRRPFRLVAFALLHIGTEPAVTQCDHFAGCGIDAQHFDAGAIAALDRALLARIRQSARELAFGIIGTADEGAEFAELQ